MKKFFPKTKVIMNSRWVRFCSIAALVGTLSHCGVGIEMPEFNSLSEQQPQVLSLTPEAHSEISKQPHWEFNFSQDIDVANFPEMGIVLIQNSSVKVFQKPSDLYKEIEAGNLMPIPLSIHLGASAKILQVSPKEDLSAGDYALIVTPKLQTPQGLPFNQKPGESATLFIAEFSVGFSDSAANSQPKTSEESSENPDSAPPQNEPPVAAKIRPEFLKINELLYDGKNSETNGESFIELQGTPQADVEGYVISFRNGSDGAETDRLLIPENIKIPDDGILVIADLKTNSVAETFVANADLFFQFDPQNGPDAVLLFDAEGKLLDALTYGEGAMLQTPDGFAMLEGNPAPDVAGGHSLSRVDGIDSGDNAVDFIDILSPSPGMI